LFTEEEKALFNALPEDGWAIGRNRPEGGQTLAQEALCLGPLVPLATLSERFPGHEGFACQNTGFVAARLSSWRQMLAQSKETWPEVARCLSNAAAVQWMMCYLIGRNGWSLQDLPLSTHAHGHLGIAPGVNRKEDGLWYYEDMLIAYAHAL
jgi:hypothetical protein